MTATCKNPECGRKFVPTRAGNVFCRRGCTDSRRRRTDGVYKVGKTTPRERTIAALTALGGRASWTVLMGKSGCSDAQLVGLCGRLLKDGIIAWDDSTLPLRERKVVLL
jgi:hypothetical protein